MLLANEAAEPAASQVSTRDVTTSLEQNPSHLPLFPFCCRPISSFEPSALALVFPTLVVKLFGVLFLVHCATLCVCRVIKLVIRFGFSIQEMWLHLIRSFDVSLTPILLFPLLLVRFTRGAFPSCSILFILPSPSSNRLSDVLALN